MCSVFHSHAMSYPISGLVRSFTTPGYNPSKPLVVCMHIVYYAEHQWAEPEVATVMNVLTEQAETSM